MELAAEGDMQQKTFEIIEISFSVSKKGMAIVKFKELQDLKNGNELSMACFQSSPHTF